MSGYFRDLEDQRTERAHDVREPEYWGEPADFDRTPDRDELASNRPAWWDKPGSHSQPRPVKAVDWVP